MLYNANSLLDFYRLDRAAVKSLWTNIAHEPLTPLSVDSAGPQGPAIHSQLF